MTDLVRGYRKREVRLEAWKMTAVFMVDEERKVAYLPVKTMSAALGVDPASQVERVRTDETYADSREMIRVPTAGGRQEMLCLPLGAAALWLISITPSKLPEHLRGHMQEVKAAIMAAADRLMWGDLSGILRAGDMQIGRPARGELTFGCPRCGAPLCFVIDGSDIHLRIDRE